MRHTTLIALASPLILVLFLARHTGSPGGATGSPGDGMTCGVNGCHGAQTPGMAQLITAQLSTGDSGVGYYPDSTYQIKVAFQRSGINRYGFEMVAEDGTDAPVGTFTGNGRVTSYISNRRVTHKATSIDSTGENGWVVQWKAPAQGTGTIHFYAAVLAANGNGNNFGDSVWVGSLQARELRPGSLGVQDLESRLGIGPNPLGDLLRVSWEGADPETLTLYDMRGRATILDPGKREFALGHLSPGLYVLEACSAHERIVRRVVKQ